MLEPRRASVLRSSLARLRGDRALGQRDRGRRRPGRRHPHAGRPRGPPPRPGRDGDRAPPGRRPRGRVARAGPRGGSFPRRGACPADARAIVADASGAHGPPAGARGGRSGHGRRRGRPRRRSSPPRRTRGSFAANREAGRTDAAYLDALALEELGAADVDAQVLIEQFRSVGPLRARGTVDESVWDLLRPEGMDEVLTALFGAIARAGGLARVER